MYFPVFLPYFGKNESYRVNILKKTLVLTISNEPNGGGDTAGTEIFFRTELSYGSILKGIVLCVVGHAIDQRCSQISTGMGSKVEKFLAQLSGRL